MPWFPAVEPSAALAAPARRVRCLGSPSDRHALSARFDGGRPMTRTGITTVAALAFTCWLSTHAPRAHAQVGTGWTEITPPSDIQVEAHDVIKSFPGDSHEAVNGGGRYTSAHGVGTLAIEGHTSNRVERRFRDDYHSGTRQFEAEVTVFAPTNDECIHQIFSDKPHHPWLLLRAEAQDGGSLKLALHDGGGGVIATGLHGKP